LTDNISEKDKKAWEKFISGDERLPNKDNKFQKKTTLKIKSIDLHGYTLEEANRSIENFITKSYEDGINKLIVVTGKGLHSQNEKGSLMFLKILVFLNIQYLNLFQIIKI
jgi:DNA-nicking Smr family endonuclease